MAPLKVLSCLRKNLLLGERNERRDQTNASSVGDHSDCLPVYNNNNEPIGERDVL